MKNPDNTVEASIKTVQTKLHLKPNSLPPAKRMVIREPFSYLGRPTTEELTGKDKWVSQEPQKKMKISSSLSPSSSRSNDSGSSAGKKRSPEESFEGLDSRTGCQIEAFKLQIHFRDNEWLSPEDGERITNSFNSASNPKAVRTRQLSDPRVLYSDEDDDLKAAIAAGLMDSTPEIKNKSWHLGK
ncbi:hypothetical protein Fot_10132 [Forsythia ovata]|uniref:Uncharacterized protein n=1 Tax=Forsythia ovata TaxID=205694 RepID=A0ABD1WG89_9LAMI